MKWTAILVPTGHRRLNELVGLLLITAALLTGLSLVSFDASDPSFNISRNARFDSAPANLIGVAGAYGSDLVFQTVGYAGFLIPIFLGLYAFQWFASASMDNVVPRVSGMFLMLSVLAAALSLTPVIPRIEGQLPPGGAAGLLLRDWLNATVNPLGTLIVLAAALLVSVLLSTTFTMTGAARVVGPWLRSAAGTGPRAIAWWEERSRQRVRERIEQRRAATLPDADRTARPAAAEIGSHPAKPAAKETVRERRREQPPRPPATRTGSPAPVPTGMPSPDLLAPAGGQILPDPDDLRERAELIERKTREFGVAGQVQQINPGPVVTTFEFKPEPGIKYSKVAGLGDDLCLALEAESIRIDRIAGKSTVGIEVPNPNRATIGLRELVESPEFVKSRALLPLALGRDIRGNMVVTDLHKMPHLLIAGSTGTGKSVSINSLVLSLVFRSPPARVRLIMIDPKRLELGLYQDIPHLLVPVVTEPVAAQNALKWAVGEMELRYKKLARRGVRTLEAYNEHIRQLPIPGLMEEDSESDQEELPYVVIVIDELADLMMVASREVEESITRLAQMARAVGIHLILATQRPSVDVITGLIKANFPARISFRVATRIDSRTILDSNGAEALLGRGDMLFLPPGSSRLMRAHGPMVTEEEVTRVADYLRAQGRPAYNESILQTPEERRGPGNPDGGRDELYDQAVRLVVEMGKASTSALQRRLRIGYGRAASLLDAMESDGIIGPPEGSRPREVLVKPDFFDEIDNRLQ